jgi:hypothetical protein
MKAEKEKTGFLRRVLTFITQNWQLKLLSLILAIIVYHSLKTNSEPDKVRANDRQILQQR